MKPQLVNNFTPAAFYDFNNFSTSSKGGNCNMELIETKQVSNVINWEGF